MTDHSADNLDNAAELTQRLNDAGIAAVQRAAKPEQVQNADGSWPFPDCVECDEPQVPGRLALGRIRCVICQSLLERRRKGL